MENMPAEKQLFAIGTKRPSRRAIVALCLAGAALVAPLPLAAQTPEDDEETKYLKMYFSDEQLVEAPARYPKSILKVAENVTIITAEEIERMNAHTVAEVLNRAPGVFLGFCGQDFGSSANPSIQGSNFDQVLLLVDGQRWNNPAGGYPETNNIPVRAIDRIEIIRGPASSTWGSSLGGVVNILTKSPPHIDSMSGAASASYGESNSTDYSGQVQGRAKWFGYYVYGGNQESDGLWDDRFFDKQDAYAKLRLGATERTSLTLSAGYSNLDQLVAQFEPLPLIGTRPSQLNGDRMRFATANFDTQLADTWFLNAAVTRTDEDAELPYQVDFPRFFYSDTKSYDTSRLSASTRLTWTPGSHTMVLGSEITEDAVDYLKEVTPGLLPYEKTLAVEGTDWAVYVNDTFTLGRLTVIPGLRYDVLAASDSVLSPSFGLVYALAPETLLRATLSRGFRKPDKYKVERNPGLNNEYVLSAQAGIETIVSHKVRLKAMGFYHDIDDTWTQKDADSIEFVNGGTSKRDGFEIEAETIAFHGLSLAANVAYVYLTNYTYEKSLEGENGDEYIANLIVRYDNPDLADVELAGHYIYWAYEPEQTVDSLWDLNIRRTIGQWQGASLVVFATAHNLFNGSQYIAELYPNPERWVEAGVRIRF